MDNSERSITIFYIPTPSLEEAQKIGQLLLEKKVIACLNIVPAVSLFWWNEHITRDDEQIIIAKTASYMIHQVNALTEKIHPYEIPCIMYWHVNVNTIFADWIIQQLA